MEQIRAGLPSGDILTVRRAAHSLKSNSASFGANRLAEAARDLEMIARNNTLEGAEAKFALIEEEFALLVPVLLERKNER
jgi:HPt (histidine-containing phosphotransfer) domain-containing protein